MQLKQKCQHFKAAKTVCIEFFKKRKFEASLISRLAQLQIDDNKLSTNDTSNIEGKSEILFWNKSANETDLDSEKERKLCKKD